ncbi:hypothetical protein PIB30_068495 [Stylosanthes scabra]|uniref:Uncharacterized protein n=1 Tax=Stylosanthes scabra TaxID=79078 RepID=A0ABU6UME7_9FABA|nr:hypothetical protein [Stylosanthes scabra]
MEAEATSSSSLEAILSPLTAPNSPSFLKLLVPSWWKVIYDKMIERSRSFGVVTMSSVKEAEIAKQKTDGYASTCVSSFQVGVVFFLRYCCGVQPAVQIVNYYLHSNLSRRRGGETRLCTVTDCANSEKWVKEKKNA